jgi:thymidylate synthase
MEIQCTTIEEGFRRAVLAILSYGDEVEIPEYGLTLEYYEPIMIRIGEAWNIQLPTAYSLSTKSLNEYAKQLTSISPDSGFAYTYGNRLFDYPTPDFVFECINGDGDGCGVNQIDVICDILKNDSNSRRAIALTRFPEFDLDSKNPPCLTTVQFKIRNNCLDCTCYFRSNDMLMAWYANAYGLTRLMEHVRYNLYWRNPIKFETLKIGTLTTISECPHIYAERDKSDIDRFRRMVYYAL